MQREITVQEVETTLNEYDNIEEPIVVKRGNKRKVVIIDMEAYQENLLGLDVMEHLRKSEEDKKNGRVKDARVALRELMTKYGD
ncbi:MAG: hypothetical protein FWC53_03060 [Firmicutes bacterium]|nr:hypothetical protein [Bacillota bacterium]